MRQETRDARAAKVWKPRTGLTFASVLCSNRARVVIVLFTFLLLLLFLFKLTIGSGSDKVQRTDVFFST